MTAPRFDALAARLLERAHCDEVEAPAPADRGRAIAVMERAMRRKRRRRLAVRSLFAAAAVAVLGVGVGRIALHRVSTVAGQVASAPAPTSVTVVGHPRGGGATVVETGAHAPLTEGHFLAAGSRILAQPDGHVVLSVSTGTRLTVEENGDVAIIDSGLDEIFAIRAGALRADVAKLGPGRRFVIRTPDAEVEVHGTSFRVAMGDADPACEDGAVTRVNVYEGVVTVRHAGKEVRLTAGQDWPSGCLAKQEPPAPRVAKAHAPASSSRVAPVESAPSATDPEQIASDLREQNDLFGRAMRAKRRGASAEAIEGFATFVARYPSSSLVESALVQRMRVLRDADPALAVRAARQYLSRYPKGFARNEAEAIEQQVP
jgi:ferric-dicitrate binding protein FerR (iron transport regulator)